MTATVTLLRNSTGALWRDKVYDIAFEIINTANIEGLGFDVDLRNLFFGQVFDDVLVVQIPRLGEERFFRYHIRVGIQQ